MSISGGLEFACGVSEPFSASGCRIGRGVKIEFTVNEIKIYEGCV
jgi:hypothetical protein